ncbi:MAG: putative hydroxymethylpyrimidine transporter CytX [Oscillospiraceae bacterium]|nr:putative hydroxymethylpyrimidine transporter CytX [Oscillospiraceae bacterium]
MEEKVRTSVFSNGLIWFGAAVSIAEILTGTFIAPLGFGKGLAAVLIGHIIGCALLYLAGLIGANTEKSAMETVKISFGEKGSVLFSALNVIQLIGWTAIMTHSGASAAGLAANLGGDWLWCLIIGALIALWIMMGPKNLVKLNTVAMLGLFLLTSVLSVVIFKGKIIGEAGGGLSFGAAVELSVAMPLSWLPLISDYTRTAEKKRKATLASAGVYFVASCWMYVIGLGAALYTGESDIARIMVTAGLGIAGLIIVVLSTVTTTYLDAFSAGVSSVSISGKINEKRAGVAVCVIGTALAIFAPVSGFESFLYFIGSAFAPMAAILITDYFILKKDRSESPVSVLNLIIWAIGFAVYRLSMQIDLPVGYTLPVMVIVSLLCIATEKIFGGQKNAG